MFVPKQPHLLQIRQGAMNCGESEPARHETIQTPSIINLCVMFRVLRNVTRLCQSWRGWSNSPCSLSWQAGESVSQASGGLLTFILILFARVLLPDPLPDLPQRCISPFWCSRLGKDMFPRGEHAAWRSAASTRRTTKSSKSTLPGTRKT